jgi:hypothetical protein
MVKRAKVERVTSGPWAGQTVADAEKSEAWVQRQLALAPPRMTSGRWAGRTVAEADEMEAWAAEGESAAEAERLPVKRALGLWDALVTAQRQEEEARADLAAAVTRREAAAAALESMRLELVAQHEAKLAAGE